MDRSTEVKGHGTFKNGMLLHIYRKGQIQKINFSFELNDLTKLKRHDILRVKASYHKETYNRKRKKSTSCYHPKRRAIPKKKIRGVYALFDSKRLVYVGMSMDLWKRLEQHKGLAKAGEEPFTDCALQEFNLATKAEILVYEAIYINFYQPIWNKGGSFGYLYK